MAEALELPLAPALDALCGFDQRQLWGTPVMSDDWGEVSVLAVAWAATDRIAMRRAAPQITMML